MKHLWAAAQCIAKRAYQLPVNQLKRGECIRHKNKLWVIVSFTHHSQGRGGSHYKLELKDIISGSKGLERFNAGTTLEGVDLTERKLQFLYSDDNRMHALDTESLEEFEFPLDILEGGSKILPFLTDDMLLRVRFHESTPLIAHCPDRGTFVVKDTPPPSSSSTSESKGMAFKKAQLENDVDVQVPEFVTTGDRIIVNLVDQKYVSRVSGK